jgi:HJR/Mrr/RecB family endonuclease
LIQGALARGSKTALMNWVFQANPKLYDIAAAIDAGIDTNWAMNQGRKLVSPGDRVFFWESGPAAKLLAIGRIISAVYERELGKFGKFAVDVSYDYRVVPPLTRSEIVESSHHMSKARAFTGFMGTNLRLLSPEVIDELELALAPRLVALATVLPGPGSPVAQIDLDKAIKNARRETAEQLQQYIAAMNPTTFEWLIRTFLLALGYSNIVVTKQSNDGGIDVRAKLIAGGIANIETAVQVKRTKSVGAPVIQNLRGSLSAHESGLLVTSGTFTEGAMKEAREPNKAPIALVDGRTLVSLLLEHEIGANQKTYKVYTLNTSALDIDTLKSNSEDVLSDPE